MTLSPLDDYPIHQAPISMRHVATTDRNFYDRYYFNCHPCSNEAFLVAGVGEYPNLGVLDGFVAVLYGGVHRVVRASKALTLDRMDTTVGRIRVEVLEPLRRLRVVCEPNEWGLEADLVWDGAVPVHAEERHFLRTNERVTFDSMRLAQVGRWTGSIVVDGTRFDVTPDHWWGSRDRSWGVRPVGEPEPPGIAAASPMEGFYWVYAPMQFDDCAVLCIVQEEPDGTRVLEQAVRVWPDAARPVERLGRPEVDLRFRPGTTDVESATWHLHEPDGAPLTIDVEPLLPMFLGKGTGYGFDDDWRHGMWQGPLVVQGVRYDLADPTVAASLFGIVDAVSRFTASDGRVGHGLFEWLVLGRHDPSGLG